MSQPVVFVLKDLWYAFRSLAKHPRFAAVTAITLALGIGANTAIFSVFNAVILRDLPYPDPDRLYMLRTTMTDGRTTGGLVSPLELLRLNMDSPSVQRAAGTFRQESSILDQENNPVKTLSYAVTDGFFDVFSTPMALGRGFSREEHSLGGAPVIVLSHGVWRNHFGGDPNIVGTTVRVEGGSPMVVGVAAKDFDFPRGADLWHNLQLDPQMTGHILDGYMRLQPGVEIDEAQADMAVISERLGRDHPAANRNRILVAQPLLEAVVGELGSTLNILLGATALLLLIACVNVTNLLLSRGTVRAREIAVRAAIGAGRGHILRQLMTESLVLASVGTVGGLILAFMGVRLLLAVGPSDLPRLDSVPIDATVLFFALGTALFTGVLVGFAPALRLARTDLRSLVNERGRGGSAGPGQRRIFAALVMVEIALAVVLVIGAGLLVLSFSKLQETDPGFEPGRIIAFELALPGATYPQYVRVADSYRELLDRIRVLSGIEAVAATSSLPLGDQLDFSIRLSVFGRPSEPGQELRARFRQVTPHFFSTMGISMVDGRAFTPRDRRNMPGVGIVNEAFVRRFFPGENPLGQRVVFENRGFMNPNPLGEQTVGEVEVVGVVSDVKYASLAEPAEASLYLPHEQATFRRMTVVSRTSLDDPAALTQSIRSEVKAMDPLLPCEFEMLPQVVAGSLARERISMILLLSFGLAALVLASVGIYGVISYSVVQRTGELAVRTAFGATPKVILRLVMRDGIRLTAAGVAFGVVAAVALGRVIASQLHMMSATDSRVLVSVPVLLVVVALTATFLPARRATKIDPVVMLRAE